LGNGLGIKGIGFDDVSAGFEEAAVNGGNDIGTREDKEIAVALEILGVILEAFPPGNLPSWSLNCCRVVPIAPSMMTMRFCKSFSRG